MSKLTPTETQIQQAFMQWCGYALKHPVWAFHVPNGLGKLGWKDKAKSAALGVRAGVSDVVIVWPGNVGFIEFKSKTGDVQSSQAVFMADMQTCGHRAAVARSADAAIDLIKAWGVPHSDRVHMSPAPAQLEGGR